jgi:hypothetical protein
VNAAGSFFYTITLGNGNTDTVNANGSGFNNITLGNGNNDVVNDANGSFDSITVGNGNDTIHVGMNDTIKVGIGQDSFQFDQTTAGNIGAVTITGFDPSKDVIVIQKALAASFSATDDSHGNVVITFPGDTQDTITLVGVHSSALHASDFQFV